MAIPTEMTAYEREAILAWLNNIEALPDEAATVLQRCNVCEEARRYFLWRAGGGQRVSYTTWADQA